MKTESCGFRKKTNSLIVEFTIADSKHQRYVPLQ